MKTNLPLETTSATALLVPELITVEGKVTTTSLQVARHFNKAHKSVLRTIQNMECGDEFRRRNFAPAKYIDEQGKPRESYQITRDGFALLAMGFTGKEAIRWKIAYLETFNRMEEALRAHYVEALIDDKQFRQGIPLKFKLKLMMQDQGLRLRKQLRTEPDHENRVALYWSLFQVNSSLGVPTESMAVLVGESVPALTRS